MRRRSAGSPAPCSSTACPTTSGTSGSGSPSDAAWETRSPARRSSDGFVRRSAITGAIGRVATIFWWWFDPTRASRRRSTRIIWAERSRGSTRHGDDERTRTNPNRRDEPPSGARRTDVPSPGLPLPRRTLPLRTELFRLRGGGRAASWRVARDATHGLATLEMQTRWWRWSRPGPRSDHAFLTGFLSFPTRSISITTSSPSSRNRGG